MALNEITPESKRHLDTDPCGRGITLERGTAAAIEHFIVGGSACAPWFSDDDMLMNAVLGVGRKP